MIKTEVPFIHPEPKCVDPGRQEVVVFEGLDQTGGDNLLAADNGFWHSPDLPRCANCGVGFQVIPKEVC